MMDSELTALIEEHQYDLLVESVRRAGGSVVETPEVTCVSTASGWPRGIFRTRFHPLTADEKIAQVLSRIRKGAAPDLWMAGLAALPPDLATRLEAHGFVRAFEAVAMALDYREMKTESACPEGLNIKKVEHPSLFTQWSRAVALWLFGMPEEKVPQVTEVLGNMWSAGALTCFAGLVDGSVVASSSLYVSRNVPGIYHVAVSPEHRRKGIGTQITLAPLLAAKASGYGTAVLQASVRAASIYSRIGFREYGRLGRFVCRPA